MSANTQKAGKMDDIAKRSSKSADDSNMMSEQDDGSDTLPKPMRVAATGRSENQEYKIAGDESGGSIPQKLQSINSSTSPLVDFIGHEMTKEPPSNSHQTLDRQARIGLDTPTLGIFNPISISHDSTSSDLAHVESEGKIISGNEAHKELELETEGSSKSTEAQGSNKQRHSAFSSPIFGSDSRFGTVKQTPEHKRSVDPKKINDTADIKKIATIESYSDYLGLEPTLFKHSVEIHDTMPHDQTHQARVQHPHHDHHIFAHNSHASVTLHHTDIPNYAAVKLHHSELHVPKAAKLYHSHTAGTLHHSELLTPKVAGLYHSHTAGTLHHSELPAPKAAGLYHSHTAGTLHHSELLTPKAAGLYHSHTASTLHHSELPAPKAAGLYHSHTAGTLHHSELPVSKAAGLYHSHTASTLHHSELPIPKAARLYHSHKTGTLHHSELPTPKAAGLYHSHTAATLHHSELPKHSAVAVYHTHTAPTLHRSELPACKAAAPYHSHRAATLHQSELPTCKAAAPYHSHKATTLHRSELPKHAAVAMYHTHTAATLHPSELPSCKAAALYHAHSTATLHRSELPKHVAATLYHTDIPNYAAVTLHRSELVKRNYGNGDNNGNNDGNNDGNNNNNSGNGGGSSNNNVNPASHTYFAPNRSERNSSMSATLGRSELSREAQLTQRRVSQAQPRKRTSIVGVPKHNRKPSKKQRKAAKKLELLSHLGIMDSISNILVGRKKNSVSSPVMQLDRLFDESHSVPEPEQCEQHDHQDHDLDMDPVASAVIAGIEGIKSIFGNIHVPAAVARHLSQQYDDTTEDFSLNPSTADKTPSIVGVPAPVTTKARVTPNPSTITKAPAAIKVPAVFPEDENIFGISVHPITGTHYTIHKRGLSNAVMLKTPSVDQTLLPEEQATYPRGNYDGHENPARPRKIFSVMEIGNGTRHAIHEPSKAAMLKAPRVDQTLLPEEQATYPRGDYEKHENPARPEKVFNVMEIGAGACQKHEPSNAATLKVPKVDQTLLPEEQATYPRGNCDEHENPARPKKVFSIMEIGSGVRHAVYEPSKAVMLKTPRVDQTLLPEEQAIYPRGNCDEHENPARPDMALNVMVHNTIHKYEPSKAVMLKAPRVDQTLLPEEQATYPRGECDGHENPARPGKVFNIMDVGADPHRATHKHKPSNAVMLKVPRVDQTLLPEEQPTYPRGSCDEHDNPVHPEKVFSIMEIGSGVRYATHEPSKAAMLKTPRVDQTLLPEEQATYPRGNCDEHENPACPEEAINIMTHSTAHKYKPSKAVMLKAPKVDQTLLPEEQAIYPRGNCDEHENPARPGNIPNIMEIGTGVRHAIHEPSKAAMLKTPRVDQTLLPEEQATYPRGDCDEHENPARPEKALDIMAHNAVHKYEPSKAVTLKAPKVDQTLLPEEQAVYPHGNCDEHENPARPGNVSNVMEIGIGTHHAIHKPTKAAMLKTPRVDQTLLPEEQATYPRGDCDGHENPARPGKIFNVMEIGTGACHAIHGPSKAVMLKTPRVDQTLLPEEQAIYPRGDCDGHENPARPEKVFSIMEISSGVRHAVHEPSKAVMLKTPRVDQTLLPEEQATYPRGDCDGHENPGRPEKALDIMAHNTIHKYEPLNAVMLKAPRVDQTLLPEEQATYPRGDYDEHENPARPGKVFNIMEIGTDVRHATHEPSKAAMLKTQMIDQTLLPEEQATYPRGNCDEHENPACPEKALNIMAHNTIHKYKSANAVILKVPRVDQTLLPEEQAAYPRGDFDEHENPARPEKVFNVMEIGSGVRHAIHEPSKAVMLKTLRVDQTLLPEEQATYPRGNCDEHDNPTRPEKVFDIMELRNPTLECHPRPLAQPKPDRHIADLLFPVAAVAPVLSMIDHEINLATSHASTMSSRSEHRHKPSKSVILKAPKVDLTLLPEEQAGYPRGDIDRQENPLRPANISDIVEVNYPQMGFLTPAKMAMQPIIAPTEAISPLILDSGARLASIPSRLPRKDTTRLRTSRKRPVSSSTLAAATPRELKRSRSTAVTLKRPRINLFLYPEEQPDYPRGNVMRRRAKRPLRIPEPVKTVASEIQLDPEYQHPHHDLHPTIVESATAVVTHGLEGIMSLLGSIHLPNVLLQGDVATDTDDVATSEPRSPRHHTPQTSMSGPLYQSSFAARTRNIPLVPVSEPLISIDQEPAERPIQVAGKMPSRKLSLPVPKVSESDSSTSSTRQMTTAESPHDSLFAPFEKAAPGSKQQQQQQQQLRQRRVPADGDGEEHQQPRVGQTRRKSTYGVSHEVDPLLYKGKDFDMSSASDRSLEIEEEVRAQEVEKNRKMHQPVTLESAFYPSAPMQYSAGTAFECLQEQGKDRDVATEEDSVKAYTMGYSAILERKFQPVSVLPPMADPRPLPAAKKYNEYSHRWEFNVQAAPQPRMMAIDTLETKTSISQPTLETPWVKLPSDSIAEPAKDKEKATMARHDAKLQTIQPNVALASAPALITTPFHIATAAASAPPASDMHLHLPHSPRHRHHDDKGQEHHHHKDPQHEELHQKGEHPRGTDIYSVAAPHIEPFISDTAAMQTSLRDWNMAELHDDPYKCQPEHHRHEHDEHRRSKDEEEGVEFSYKSDKNEHLSDDCSSTTSNDYAQSLRSTTAPWTSHEEPDKIIPHPVSPSRHDSPYGSRFRSPIVSSMGVDKDNELSQTKEREVHETPILGTPPYAASDENPIPSSVYPRDSNVVTATNMPAGLPKPAPVSREFREPSNSEETLMDQSQQGNNHKSTSNVFRRPMDPLRQ